MKIFSIYFIYILYVNQIQFFKFWNIFLILFIKYNKYSYERGVIIKYFKYVLFAFFIFSVNICNVFANESYDYTYNGVEIWGNNIGDANTAIINLTDKNGNVFNTYCIDYNTGIENDWNYSLINVDDSSYIDKNTSDIIRNIVTNAYPFVGIEYIKNIAGIENLTEEEAIAGAQASIWHYANGYSFTLEGNVKTLYEFYINMNKINSLSTDISNIDINFKTYFEDGIRNILITIDSTNVFDLDYSFDKDISLEYGVTIEERDNKILIKNVPANAEFTINVFGKQTINKDVYFFYPKGGESSSQSLVGVTSGTINISNTKKITVQDNNYKVTINKKDSVTNKSIAGVIFKLSNTNDFSQYVFEKTTDENGVIVFDNIPSGTWYLKEINTPDGYIKEENILKVDVNNDDVSLNIFNHPFGKIKILKVNEYEERLDNVTFNLYKDKVDKNNLIKENIVTDTNGEIIIENLEQGKYILIETKTKNGYNLYTDEIIVNVEHGKTNEVKVINVKSHETSNLIVNKNISTGNLIIRKIDSENKNFLKGSTIGIYKDIECTELFLEINTTNEEYMIKDIPTGTYCVKELKAPNGYILNIDKFIVEVGENNSVNLEILNHRIYKTGLNNNLIFTTGIISFIIFISLFVGYNLWIKRKQ